MSYIQVTKNSRLYNGKAEDVIPLIDDESIDLVITSPPYNVDLGNNKFNKTPYDLYNDNKDHFDYIKWLKNIFEQIYPKLVSGARVAINIGDGQNGRVPTHADIIHFMTRELNYIPMANIVWDKKQIGNRTSWGSFASPSSPSFPKPFEYIMIFAKDNVKLQTKGETDLHKEEFKKWAYSLWDMTAETQMKKIGHPACVDSETECLTTMGWKKYDELKVGDKIASFNIEKEYIEWDDVKDITSYRHKGEVIKVEGRSINMVLSKDHNCLIKKSFKTINKPTFRKVRADHLKKKDLIPCSAAWKDEKCKIKSPSTDIAALLGWFLSEGNYIYHKNKKIYTIEINQSISKNPKKVKEIERILRETNSHYRRVDRDRKHSYNKSLSSKIATFYISKDTKDMILNMDNGKKEIPKDILLWNRDSLEAFFFAMISGDGYFRKKSKSFSFTQWKDNSYLNTMQAIGVRLGFDSYISYNNKYIEFTHKKHKSLRNSKDSLIKTDIYDGVMWCPYVGKNNTFVARRKGRVFITGNCFPICLPYRLMKMLSWKNATILDPFSGAGTTGVACEMTGRKYIGIELSKEYCDLSQKRISETKEEDDILKISEDMINVVKNMKEERPEEEKDIFKTKLI
jgi:DNA modification methylase